MNNPIMTPWVTCLRLQKLVEQRHWFPENLGKKKKKNISQMNHSSLSSLQVDVHMFGTHEGKQAYGPQLRVLVGLLWSGSYCFVTGKVQLCGGKQTVSVCCHSQWSDHTRVMVGSLLCFCFSHLNLTSPLGRRGKKYFRWACFDTILDLIMWVTKAYCRIDADFSTQIFSVNTTLFIKV